MDVKQGYTDSFVVGVYVRNTSKRNPGGVGEGGEGVQISLFTTVEWVSMFVKKKCKVTRHQDQLKN